MVDEVVVTLIASAPTINITSRAKIAMLPRSDPALQSGSVMSSPL